MYRFALFSGNGRAAQVKEIRILMMKCSSFLALALLSSLGCGMFGQEIEEKWVSGRLADVTPLRDLLTECEWAFLQASFPPGDVDFGTLSVMSGWDVQTHPFSGVGVRSQALVELEAEQETGRTLIQVRVRRQKNTEVQSPLDLGKARWEDISDDLTRAQILMAHIVSRVRPGSNQRETFSPRAWSPTE